MLQFRGRVRALSYALALLAITLPVNGGVSCFADDEPPTASASQDTTAGAASSEPLAPPEVETEPLGKIVRLDEPPRDEPLDEANGRGWAWEWVPTGLIYHSYQAGVHEPRMALVTISDMQGGAFWDATLGGRTGLLQYGNGDPVHPEGYQLDFYGAAIARLDLEQQEDLNSCDYVFGLPITMGNEQWQAKFGYAHLSSHLGDELAIRVPSTLANRDNYVRDSLVWGTSYYLIPAWRLYSEAGWAFHRDGGAGPWETQFGTEISRPGPTGHHSVPFFAINGRLRDDGNVGGDVTAEAGLLRRGILGQTFRVGAHYYNGKSSQSEFYKISEEQIGLGVWYDF